MRWTKEAEELLTDLVGQGLSDTEVATELSRQLNLSFTKDSVRGRRKKLGLETSEPKTFEEKVSEEKNRAKAAQLRTAEAREVKQQARHEELLETIREAIGPLKFSFKPAKFPQASGDEEEAVLDLSDLHFGKKTAQYSIEIAHQRFNTLMEGVKKVTALHRKAYPIRTLHIMWGGDIVDGNGIYPTQQWHTDKHVVNQIFSVVPALVDHLGQLCQMFETVNCYCVRGNHGRISKESHENANFDNIFYFTLQLATAGISNLKWTISDNWFLIIPILNERVLLTHGHQIKMTMNLPWYAVTLRIMRWFMTQRIGQFTIVHLHHMHHSSRIRWQNVRVFTNGTMVCEDDFGTEFIGLEASECQWFYGIHPTRGVTWSYELDFKEGV